MLNLVDTAPPVFVNQQLKNISKVVNCTDPTTTVSWDEPNTKDNSGEYTLSSNYKPGDHFPIGETTLIVYFATDPSGNVASLSFFVTLSGNIKLVIVEYLFEIL